MGKRFSFLAIGVGYALLVWAAIQVPLPTEERPLVFYSNQRRSDLRLVFREAIENASRSVSVTMYSLTDSAMIRYLHKSSARGVDVKVFYDKSATPAKALRGLRAEAVKTKGLMHKKLVVIDEAVTFLGSANMTTSSLVLHDNLTVGFYNEGLARFIAAGEGSSYTEEGLQLFMLPDIEGKALGHLLETLRSASHRIEVAMFTLTHPEVVDALLEAASRGVRVVVAVDFYTARGASLKAITRLQKGGVKVVASRGGQLLHHKWALIDRKHLILGSTNWTKAAFKKNQDTLLFLTDLPVKERKYLTKLWKVVILESEELKACATSS